MKEVEVKAANPYKIIIGNKAYSKLIPVIKKQASGNYGIIITNKTIYKIFGKVFTRIFPKNKSITFKTISLPDTEKIKSFTFLLKIINEIGTLDFKKQPFIICWGGGVIGDLGGFTASIYKRGIPYIQMPTTLLAQIDSSIGGKTALDLKTAKNLIGSFFQPKAVISDINFIKTLPLSQMREGLAEAVKYGLLDSHGLLNFIEENTSEILNKKEKPLTELILSCAKIKAKIVSEDEHEIKGIRTILNLGHTVGHGIEASSNYRISHGKAVGLGLIAALKISHQTGILKDTKLTKRVSNLLTNIGLPSKIKLNKEKALEAIKRDKKFIKGKTRLVLIKDTANPVVQDGIKTAHILKGIDAITA